MNPFTPERLDKVVAAFEAFRDLAGVADIDSEADYDRAIALTSAILDATRDSQARETHRLHRLLDWLTPAIAAYEAAHFPLPDAPPREALRFLMEQHGLRQSDLPEVGNQEVVSQILSGQHSLNVRQVAALARRFNVSAEVFVEQQVLTA